MNITLEAKPLPLHLDDDGVIRVANTRITLDTIIESFSCGSTPEEIALQYPSLSLADVYQVIGYYLNNEAKIKGYLNERRDFRDRIKQENIARFNQIGLRERLMERKSSSV